MCERGTGALTTDEKRAWAEELLRQKQEELGRIPHKDDFDEPTRSRIKAFLGPWPRALEAAGLKEPRACPHRTRRPKRRTDADKKRNASGPADAPPTHTETPGDT